jgi:hypothetical protein
VATATTVPANFLSGGSGLTPNKSSGSLSVETILRDHQTQINTGAITLSQSASNDAGAAGAALTDADATITLAQGRWRVLPAAVPLTVNRVITLSATGGVAGDQITVTRLGVGAFTLAFVNGGAGAGTLLTLPVGIIGFAKFQFDGTNWAVRETGTIGT